MIQKQTRQCRHTPQIFYLLLKPTHTCWTTRISGSSLWVSKLCFFFISPVLISVGWRSSPVKLVFLHAWMPLTWHPLVLCLCLRTPRWMIYSVWLIGSDWEANTSVSSYTTDILSASQAHTHTPAEHLGYQALFVSLKVMSFFPRPDFRGRRSSPVQLVFLHAWMPLTWHPLVLCLRLSIPRWMIYSVWLIGSDWEANTPVSSHTTDILSASQTHTHTPAEQLGYQVLLCESQSYASSLFPPSWFPWGEGPAQSSLCFFVICLWKCLG